MSSTSKNFQEMADKIANAFFTKGTSLEDGIVAEATKGDFNPEEVKRLVEKTNTAASIQFLKNTEDKKGTFDLANYEDVLKRTHPKEDDSAFEDTETDDDTGITIKDQKDDAKDVKDSGVAEIEKTSSLLPQTRYRKLESPLHKVQVQTKVASSDTPIISARTYYAAKNELDHLKLQKVSAELRLQSAIDHVSTKFKTKPFSEFNKLASDAADLYGNILKPVFTVIGTYLGGSPKFVKEGAFIDDSGKDMQLMKQTAEDLVKLSELNTKIEELSGYLDSFHVAISKHSL